MCVLRVPHLSVDGAGNNKDPEMPELPSLERDAGFWGFGKTGIVYAGFHVR